LLTLLKFEAIIRSVDSFGLVFGDRGVL